jgi:hypothetical protein
MHNDHISDVVNGWWDLSNKNNPSLEFPEI